jgi:hypothetical protein
MATLFSSLDPELLRTQTADVIASMMDTVRKHQVHLKGVVSTVVVSGEEGGLVGLHCLSSGFLVLLG